MTTAARILDVARSQIGTTQDRSGSNKYGRAYGMDRAAWCAMFAWWVFREAGASPLIPKTAWTPSMAAWYQQRGLASKTPRVGSLVFYNWPGDGVNRIQHVGIVEAINPDGTITTIEGNTASGTIGNQSNGGGVYRRRRSQSAVVTYGHPTYDVAPVPAGAGTYVVQAGDTLGKIATRLGTTTSALAALNGITDPNRIAVGQVLKTSGAAAPPPPFDPNSMATLQRGMGPNDSRVMALQRFLNAEPWQPELPLITTSAAKGFGTYGPATQDVVQRAQAQCGITGPDADGSLVGPRTKAAFAARGARW